MHPVDGYPVSTRYGIHGAHWTACGWHTGADIAAPQGTPVRACRPGRAVFVNYGSSFGVQLAIRGDRTEDFYAHLARIDVAAGQAVDAGQVIGAVGSTGNSTGPHLHLESHTAHGWRCEWMQDPEAVAIPWTPDSGGDDDMTPHESQQLAKIAQQVADLTWSMGQVRGTDFPRVNRQTDLVNPRILGNVEDTDWLVKNSVINALNELLRRTDALPGAQHMDPLPAEAPDDAAEG